MSLYHQMHTFWWKFKMFMSQMVNEVILRAVYKRQSMHRKVMTRQIFFKSFKNVIQKPSTWNLCSVWPLSFWSSTPLLASSSFKSTIFHNKSSCFLYYYLHSFVAVFVKKHKKLKFSGIPANWTLSKLC